MGSARADFFCSHMYRKIIEGEYQMDKFTLDHLEKYVEGNIPEHLKIDFKYFVSQMMENDSEWVINEGWGKMYECFLSKINNEMEPK
jgi:hypothetical protein